MEMEKVLRIKEEKFDEFIEAYKDWFSDTSICLAVLAMNAAEYNPISAFNIIDEVYFPNLASHIPEVNEAKNIIRQATLFNPKKEKETSPGEHKLSLDELDKQIRLSCRTYASDPYILPSDLADLAAELLEGKIFEPYRNTLNSLYPSSFDGDTLNNIQASETTKETKISEALKKAHGDRKVAANFLKSQIATKTKEISILTEAIIDILQVKEDLA